MLRVHGMTKKVIMTQSLTGEELSMFASSTKELRHAPQYHIVVLALKVVPASAKGERIDGPYQIACHRRIMPTRLCRHHRSEVR